MLFAAVFDNFSPVEILDTDGRRMFFLSANFCICAFVAKNKIFFNTFCSDLTNVAMAWLEFEFHQHCLRRWFCGFITLWATNIDRETPWKESSEEVGLQTLRSDAESLLLMSFTSLLWRDYYFLLWPFEIWFALSPTLGCSNKGEEIAKK